MFVYNAAGEDVENTAADAAPDYDDGGCIRGSDEHSGGEHDCSDRSGGEEEMLAMAMMMKIYSLVDGDDDDLDDDEQ